MSKYEPKTDRNAGRPFVAILLDCRSIYAWFAHDSMESAPAADFLYRCGIGVDLSAAATFPMDERQ